MIEKNDVKELGEDMLVYLNRLASIREVTNKLDGISKMSDEYFILQREIYE